MNFVTGLLILIDWKIESYESILVIVDCLTKMIYYGLVKVRIDITRLVKDIINMVIRHYGLPE